MWFQVISTHREGVDKSNKPQHGAPIIKDFQRVRSIVLLIDYLVRILKHDTRKAQHSCCSSIDAVNKRYFC